MQSVEAERTLWQVYIPHNAELLSLILDIINAAAGNYRPQ